MVILKPQNKLSFFFVFRRDDEKKKVFASLCSGKPSPKKEKQPKTQQMSLALTILKLYAIAK
jgi:hypothetical protein